MKEAAYALRRKLGNSWGLTLIVAGTVLQILSSMFLSFPGGMGDAMDSSNPFAMMLSGVAVLGSLVGLICTGAQITGVVLVIVEKIQLKERWHQMHLERAEAARAAGEVYSMPEKRSKGRFLKDNIGLALVATSILTSALGVMMVMGVLIFALSTDGIFTDTWDSSSMSDLENTTFIIAVIFGLIMILFAGLLFPAGVIVAIVQEIRKRNWMEAELAAHYGSAAPSGVASQEGHTPVVDEVQRSESDRSGMS